MGKRFNIDSFSWFCYLVFYHLSYTGRTEIKEIECIRVQFSYYLKRRSLYHLVLLFASVFLVARNIHAQETIITDTTVQVVPADDDEGSTYVEETGDEKFYQDSLISNYRSVIYDSVLAVTGDKGFYYKRYLDSLLRATQPTAEKPRPRRTVNFNSGYDFFSSIFGIIFWIVAIGLFAYLVYRLFLSNSSFFTRNRKNVSSDIQITAEDAKDPDAMLRNAIRNGNYRLAVRYLYLQALRRLSERKFIEIHANKTNYEYVNEVRKHKFANEFASLTLQYEYVWYGEYPVEERLFEQIQEGFIQFNKNYTR